MLSLNDSKGEVYVIGVCCVTKLMSCKSIFYLFAPLWLDFCVDTIMIKKLLKLTKQCFWAKLTFALEEKTTTCIAFC